VDPLFAWAIILGLFVAPLLHALLSPRGGPFRPPPASGCPLGPRVGWIVIVVLLGPIGRLMYMRGPARRRRAGAGS